MSDLIISCPDCSTRYKTSAESVGTNGRTVRCAKCGTTWFVPGTDILTSGPSNADALAFADNIAAETKTSGADAPGPLPEPVEASSTFGSMPAPAAQIGADVIMRDHVDRERLIRRQRTIRLIWGFSLLLIIIAAIIAYWNRQAIVNRIPQMATLYNAVGIEVRVGGLEIDPPQARTVIVDGKAVIRVESVVRNLTTQEKDVPLIELTLHDSDGQGLVQWYVEPDPSRIAGKGRLVFTTEITDPPTGATGLRYRFSDESDWSQVSG